MKHSKHCPCNGTNKVPQHESKMLPTGTIINGVRDVPCPYGYLTINKKVDNTNFEFPSSLDDFEF